MPGGEAATAAEVPVSVLVLTRDEEANIADCIASVGWSSDVVVLDSFSTDRTVELAQAAGARVVQRAFDDYASQRNFGLSGIDYRNPWVLLVDADERVPDDLAREIGTAIAASPAGVALFRMRRKDHFMGRWLRRASGYPTWFGRLARVGRVRVTRAVNEEYEADGETRELSGHLIHYPFSKGVAHWVDKHNRYSTLEAAILARDAGPPMVLGELVDRDPVARRRAFKALAYRMPGRPVMVFLGLYLLRGGILDGVPGLAFCALRAFYELLIDLKAAEIRRRAVGLVG